MNRHNLIILVNIFLVGCTSVQTKKEGSSTAETLETSENFKSLDTIVNFSGYWVNESYVNSVKKTKSPVKTHVPENSCIWIPKRTLQFTGMIDGFHEGGESLLP